MDRQTPALADNTLENHCAGKNEIAILHSRVAHKRGNIYTLCKYLLSHGSSV